MLSRIKLKLIVTNTLVLSIILLIIMGCTYYLTFSELKNSVDNELINISYEATRFLNLGYNIDANDQDTAKEYEYFLSRVSSFKAGVLVFNTKGKVVYSNGILPLSVENTLNLSQTYLKEGFKSERKLTRTENVYYMNTYNEKGSSIRLCTQAIQDENGTLKNIVVTITNMDREKSVLSKLTYAIIFVFMNGILLSLAGGYYTATKALVPIKRNMESQKQFIADASHELKTPLSVVKTNLELVISNEDELVKDQELWLNNMSSEIDRMSHMISELLFLSKADLKQIEFKKQNYDLTLLIKETIEKVKPLANANKIKLMFVENTDKINVLVDKEKFIQLIMILLDNAIKYSYEDKNVVIYTGLYKNYALIEVVDEGIGISEENILKVFERFYSVNKDRRKGFANSGLGLSIARWIVTEHTGLIEIESELEQGTTVSVFIPLSANNKGEE